MDTISEARLFVDDMELANRVFYNGLGFGRVFLAKKYSSYEMGS